MVWASDRSRSQVSWSKLTGALGLATLGLVLNAAPSPAQSTSRFQRAPGVVSAQEFLKHPAAGEPVDLAGVTVEGDVDLQPLGVVRGTFRCQRCRFTGSLNAAGVVFEGIVDASGSSVAGTVDLGGATLKDGATFAGARFLDDVSFTGGTFLSPAVFDRVQMRGRAFFDGATFVGDAHFVGTAFQGRSDFARAEFHASSDFGEALFADRASFVQARFFKKASFEGAQFQGGGNFRLIEAHDRLSFAETSAAGTLEFNAAEFGADVTFSHLASSGSVSFEGILLDRGARLSMSRLSAADLSMEPIRAEAVRGRTAETEALHLIEHSAKAHGDLRLANDARFRLLRLAGEWKGDDGDRLGHLLDAFVYRRIAGYLVRPLHPLVAFLLLVAAAGALRSTSKPVAVLRGGSTGRGERRPGLPRTMVQRLRQAVLTAQKAVTAVLSGVATAFTIAFRRRPHIKVEDPDRVGAYFVAALRWGEFLAYKLLLATFLLALGNSNATVRQLLDSVGVRG